MSGNQHRGKVEPNTALLLIVALPYTSIACEVSDTDACIADGLSCHEGVPDLGNPSSFLTLVGARRLARNTSYIAFLKLATTFS